MRGYLSIKDIAQRANSCDTPDSQTSWLAFQEINKAAGIPIRWKKNDNPPVEWEKTDISHWICDPYTGKSPLNFIQ